MHTLGFTKTLDIRVSIKPIDGAASVRKPSEQKLAENLNVGREKNDKIYRKYQNGRNRVAQTSLDDWRGNVGFGGKPGSEHSQAVNLNRKREDKCSWKWASYGGSIPSILRTLETISNLDEALKPWEESLNNKERSIILKEQSNWERALEIFEWFKRKGCYELNVIHYNIILRILGKARRWDEVENLWGEMESRRITPTNSTFGTLIDVYSKGGLKEEALCWLDKMFKQGLEPDEVTVGIVIQTYKKAGQFGKAEQFFKTWSSSKFSRDEGRLQPSDTSLPQTCCSSYTYNTLIDTYGKAGRLKEASDTFAQMLREGVLPNTVTFNTMIHICGNHDRMDEVAALIKKMEELQCPPDTRTYNILIHLHAKHDHIDAAARYFKEMKAVGLEPDIVSYRTLLYAFSIRQMVTEAEALVFEMDTRGLDTDEYTQSALTRMYIDAGMLGQSWSWFQRFHLGGEMSSECYSANIDAFGERGYLLEAEKAFLCCQEKQKLTVMEFNVMIKAYGIGKLYDKACDLFDYMGKHSISPDKCTYNSLIQILSGAELPCRARFYLGKMQEAGLVNDCIPYGAVISSYVKLGLLGIAEELFTEMIGHGVQPDIIVFGIFINAFANAGSVKEAMKYVEAMKNAGFSGDSAIYNSLIKLYTKVGYLQEAQEIYKLLQSLDDGPHVYSSNCMIDLYSERAMVRSAEEIFEYLKKRGEANEFSFAMMLCMYKKMGRFNEAVALAHEMHELGLLTDVLSYNNVIRLYASDGRLKEAAETFYQMIDLSVHPDDSTFRSLGVILLKCGASKEAINRLELARKKDTQSGICAWIETLCSMVGEDNDALKLCNKIKCPLEFDSDIENMVICDCGSMNG